MNLTVLIVDDDPAIRSGVSQILQLRGYTPVTARDGREALERLKTATPGLILLDLMMPEMDGRQFLLAMRERGEHRAQAIPVIVMTANREGAQGLEELGASGLIVKPFGVRELLEAISGVSVNET